MLIRLPCWNFFARRSAVNPKNICACGLALLLISTFALGQRATRNQSNDGDQAAAKFCSTYVASCGGAHYVRKAPGIFVELRGFRITTSYDSLTAADRLNGIQSKGSSRFNALTHRVYSNGRWHEWRDGIPEDMQLINSVRFQRARGQWSFIKLGYFANLANPVTCGDVPGFRNPAAKEVATNTIQIDDYHNFPIQNFFFWESSSNEIAERFPKSVATFINWKLEYTGTAFSYKPPPVEAIWFKDGVKWGSQSANFSNVSKGQFWAGKGWEEPGQWETGKYTVKIYVRQQLVRVGEFEIVADEKLPALLRYDDEGIYSVEEERLPYKIWFRFSRDGTVVYLYMPKTEGDPSGFGCPNTLGESSLARAQVCLKTDKIWGSNNCDRCNTRMVGTYAVNGSQINITLNELSYTPKELRGKEGTFDNFTGTIEHNRLSLSTLNSPPDKFRFTAAKVWVR